MICFLPVLWITLLKETMVLFVPGLTMFSVPNTCLLWFLIFMFHTQYLIIILRFFTSTFSTPLSLFSLLTHLLVIKFIVLTGLKYHLITYMFTGLWYVKNCWNSQLMYFFALILIVPFIRISWTFMLIMLFLFWLIVLLLVSPLVSPPLKTLLVGMIVLVS